MLLKYVCVGIHTINSWDIAMYSNLISTKILGLKKIDNSSKVTINFTILEIVYYV